MNVCVCAHSVASVMPDSETPWTVACQAPLSMGFSRQEYWNGLLSLFQGIFLTQESNLGLLCLLHCRCVLYRWATGEAVCVCVCVCVYVCVYTRVGQKVCLDFSVRSYEKLKWTFLANPVCVCVCVCVYFSSTYYPHILTDRVFGYPAQSHIFSGRAGAGVGWIMFTALGTYIFLHCSPPPFPTFMLRACTNH